MHSEITTLIRFSHRIIVSLSPIYNGRAKPSKRLLYTHSSRTGAFHNNVVRNTTKGFRGFSHAFINACHVRDVVTRVYTTDNYYNYYLLFAIPRLRHVSFYYVISLRNDIVTEQVYRWGCGYDLLNIDGERYYLCNTA